MPTTFETRRRQGKSVDGQRIGRRTKQENVWLGRLRSGRATTHLNFPEMRTKLCTHTKNVYNTSRKDTLFHSPRDQRMKSDITCKYIA